MKYINKIYTKLGDNGLTTMINGEQVTKYSNIIELCGNIDELTVFLCHSAESLCNQPTFEHLLSRIYQIQKKLFSISSSMISKNKTIVNVTDDINILEKEIDYMSEQLPIVHSFILPGGGEEASRLHLARVVCRRVERMVFKMIVDEYNISVNIGSYLNRLGDWLYVAARFTAMKTKKEELPV